MADPLRHRQTKGAATDMVDLTPPRHIPTLLQLGRFRRVLRTAGVAHEHQFLLPRLRGRYRFTKPSLMIRPSRPLGQALSHFAPSVGPRPLPAVGAPIGGKLPKLNQQHVLN